MALVCEESVKSQMEERYKEVDPFCNEIINTIESTDEYKLFLDVLSQYGLDPELELAVQIGGDGTAEDDFYIMKASHRIEFDYIGFSRNEYCEVIKDVPCHYIMLEYPYVSIKYKFLSVESKIEEYLSLVKSTTKEYATIFSKRVSGIVEEELNRRKNEANR